MEIDKEYVFINDNDKQNNIEQLEKEAFYRARYLNEITDEDTDDNKKLGYIKNLKLVVFFGI